LTLTVLPLLRAVRSRRAWLLLAGGAALSLGSAWVQHRHAAPHGADHVLLHLYGSVAVPLIAFGIVGAVLDGGSLARSGLAMRRLGASPARVAGSTVLVGIVLSAITCGALGAGVAAWAHGAGDPPALRDALETAGLGAAGGAAYAAYLAFGGAMGAGAWGRTALIVVDWMVGDGVDVASALTPRAHLRNLLGGAGPADLAPVESLASLLCLTLLYAAAATRLSTLRRRG
jgi:hypothetical protein